MIKYISRVHRVCLSEAANNVAVTTEKGDGTAMVSSGTLKYCIERLGSLSMAVAKLIGRSLEAQRCETSADSLLPGLMNELVRPRRT